MASGAGRSSGMANRSPTLKSPFHDSTTSKAPSAGVVITGTMWVERNDESSSLNEGRNAAKAGCATANRSIRDQRTLNFRIAFVITQVASLKNATTGSGVSWRKLSLGRVSLSADVAGSANYEK